MSPSDTAGSTTHPSSLNVVGADGKVVRSRYLPRRLDKETGELIDGNRRDKTAKYHMTGTGERVLGNRFVVASTRGDDENQRVILDITIAPRARGEAAHALDLFDELLPLLDAPEVIVYDGELRGSHLRRLMKKHGLIPLARLHNKRGSKALERHCGTATVHHGDNRTSTVDLHLFNGAACIRDLDEEGNIHLTDLRRTKLTKVQRGDGAWRWYIELKVPESHGGGTIRLRCDEAPEDEVTGLNRAEYLRLIPDNDPDWPALMGRRQDSESGNRVIDDSYWRERAHSNGDLAQLLDLLGHMIHRNCRAVVIHRRRQADAALLAA